MKLITAIVNKDDSTAVQAGLTSGGFSVTRLATTGGFLMAGNVTFITAVDDDKVDAAIDIISAQSKQRKQLVPATSSYGLGISSSYPLEVTVGGATIFVQAIERFEKF
ncbi:MAG: cyclic-di-AMP receptor [Oscillospiraceae bacterium]